MNIGIIGSGNMGTSMGKIWAAKGHKVLFSFSKDQEKLRAVAAAAGPNTRTGTPAGAVAFGELILLSVPWTAVPEALKAAGNFDGKTLLSCVNCLKPEIVKLAPTPKWSRPSRRWRKSWRRTPAASMGSRSVPSTAATTLSRRRALRVCCATSTSIPSMPVR